MLDDVEGAVMHAQEKTAAVMLAAELEDSIGTLWRKTEGRAGNQFAVEKDSARAPFQFDGAIRNDRHQHLAVLVIDKGKSHIR